MMLGSLKPVSTTIGASPPVMRNPNVGTCCRRPGSCASTRKLVSSSMSPRSRTCTSRPIGTSLKPLTRAASVCAARTPAAIARSDERQPLRRAARRSRAVWTASAREVAPSLRNRLRPCVLAVASEMPRRTATCLKRSPSSSASSSWRSRAVSCGAGSGGASGSTVRPLRTAASARRHPGDRVAARRGSPAAPAGSEARTFSGASREETTSSGACAPPRAARGRRRRRARRPSSRRRRRCPAGARPPRPARRRASGRRWRARRRRARPAARARARRARRRGR